MGSQGEPSPKGSALQPDGIASSMMSVYTKRMVGLFAVLLMLHTKQVGVCLQLMPALLCLTAIDMHMSSVR